MTRQIVQPLVMHAWTGGISSSHFQESRAAKSVNPKRTVPKIISSSTLFSKRRKKNADMHNRPASGVLPGCLFLSTCAYQYVVVIPVEAITETSSAAATRVSSAGRGRAPSAGKNPRISLHLCSVPLSERYGYACALIQKLPALDRQ